MAEGITEQNAEPADSAPFADPNGSFIVEEFEPVEELEPLEEAEPAELAEAEGVVSVPGIDDSALWVTTLPENHFSSSRRIFTSCVFPVLMMTPDFKINYANKAARQLFPNIPKIEGSPFINTFGGFFKMEDIKSIRETILRGRNNHAWKGKAYIKSRVRTTVETRVYLFPTGFDNHEPVEFGVMFDDVTEEMKHFLRNVFMSLLEASKLKDNDTGKHIERVNYYSEVLVRALQNRPGYDIVDADFIDNISFLAAMHDVGKIGTPDDILNKEGPLSDFEWSVMKEHTINGAFILSTYPNPMAREIAISHHEKWNGSGYPYQLSGDTIPLSARIVAIADVYDALRMKRSYKPPYSHDVAMKKILESKGTHFDPDLVDILVTVADKFGEVYSANTDDPE
ncbi:MAG: HD domain-containing protein [Spirochaetaceae bacterium]|jgi:putative two-component system response regulator|nr:HD domain-containing protein [Spirochaetaceae bacterium]